MPSRTVRHRRNKRLAALAALTELGREEAGRGYLLGWRREARRRAATLGAPAVWGLARDPRVTAVARALDPGGGLHAELNRVCAEAVAAEAGRPLLAGSRPPADRDRQTRRS